MRWRFITHGPINALQAADCLVVGQRHILVVGILFLIVALLPIAWALLRNNLRPGQGIVFFVRLRFGPWGYLHRDIRHKHLGCKAQEVWAVFIRAVRCGQRAVRATNG
ncbi:hypothetical protein D9M71_542630 [compost metagenome]